MTNTTNTERLKPCPFCGQPGFLSKAGSPEWFSVGCSGLFGCPAYLRAQVHRTESAAIAAWNRRAAPAVEPVQSAEPYYISGPYPDGSYGMCETATGRIVFFTGKSKQQSVEPNWDGSEGWESLAWELCADENGEESCNELIWEGGPIPEPWGERWLKYDGEAKRLIALVHKHAPCPPQQSAEPVVYVELTDAECDEFRRHQGDFNSMLRATHRAGYSWVVVSPPAPREPLTADEATKNKYGEWTHTIKGQPVSDNVPLKHECDGGSDYCMHCGIDMTGPYGSTSCDGLEQARRRQIKPETVAVFGCDAEARGLGACQQWCQGLQCPYTRSAAGDERTHGTGTDREGE